MNILISTHKKEKTGSNVITIDSKPCVPPLGGGGCFGLVLPSD